jgi:hypothetical protein
MTTYIHILPTLRMQINQKLSKRPMQENNRPHIGVIPSKCWVTRAKYNILWPSGCLHFAGTWRYGKICFYLYGGTAISASETLLPM